MPQARTIEGAARPPARPRTAIITLIAVVLPPLGHPGGDRHALGRRGRARSTSRCSRSSTSSPASASRSASTATSPTAASRRAAPIKTLLAVLGSMTSQGPVCQWVSDHRKHHAHSDVEGDPHSPHVGSGVGRDGRRARVLALARRLAVQHEGPRRAARSTAATCSRTRSCATSTASTSSGSTLGFVAPVRRRLRARRRARRRGGDDLGRSRAHRRVPAHHLERQLDLPHVRPARLRRARREPQQLAARAAVAGRGVAQQPPRLPVVRRARPRPLPVRPLRARDPRAREGRARLGRQGARRHEPGTPPAPQTPRRTRVRPARAPGTNRTCDLSLRRAHRSQTPRSSGSCANRYEHTRPARRGVEPARGYGGLIAAILRSRAR